MTNTSLRRGHVVAAGAASCLLLAGAVGAGGAGAVDRPSWEQARARAAASGEFMLVEVGASWCHACNMFAARTLADSAVCRALATGWIAVEVDVDRRPDLHRLFHARGHEGLPSLHFLDPAGKEILRTGFLGPHDLVGMLVTARLEAHAARDLLPERGERQGGSAACLDSERTPESYMRGARERLLAAADTAHGGFGPEAKYLLTPELDFLLALASSGDLEAKAALRRLIAGALSSPTYDVEEGGFHRYSVSPDWSAPHYEKLLEVQAAMIEALSLDARASPSAFDEDLKAVRQTLEFLAAGLYDPPTGLFFASMNADVVSDASRAIIESGESYYARPAMPVSISSWYGSKESSFHPPMARRPVPAPPVDRTILTSANARLGSALILAGEVFREPSFGTQGRRLLAAVLSELGDEEARFLRWKAEEGRGPAGIEDLAEVGLLLLASRGEQSLYLARHLGMRVLEHFVQPDGNLRARAEKDDSELAADVGEDGARTIVFLSKLAAASGGSAFLDAARRAFCGLCSAVPEPEPAAVGLAAWALSRLGGRAPRDHGL